MNSSEYWKNRAVWRMYEAMEEAERTADMVAEIYFKSFSYLESQLEDIFERFRKRHGLSTDEAARLIEQMRSPEDIEGLKQLLRNDPTDVAKTEILAELESAAYAARLKRLATLQVQIGAIMRQVYKQELLESEILYKTLAEDSYYKTIFDIQQRAGVGFSFNYIDEKQIDTVLRMNWSGQHYSQRIWNNTQKVAEKVQEEVLLSLLTGKTEREAAEGINKQFASGASRSRRLIRTESNFVTSELNFQAYEATEIEEYQYLATLDLKTSKVCRFLDGKIFKVTERQTGINCPPMHPWCRSTTVSVVDRNFIATMTRSAREPKTGKIIKVPRSMTYEEWYQKYVKDVPEAKQKEKNIRNKSADRKQHEKYRAIFGKDVPESLAEFQEMKYNDVEKWERLKREKQDTLNQMDFSEMNDLKGKLSNKETRLWYKAHDSKIPDLADSSLPLRERAKQAFELRNQFRMQARDLMADQEARTELDAKHPNPSFEQMLEHKRLKYNLSEEEAYKDILRSSQTTNKKYDKIAGVKERQD